MPRSGWLVPLCSASHGFHTVLGEPVDDPFVCGTSCAEAGQGREVAHSPTPKTKSSRTKMKKRRMPLQDKRRAARHEAQRAICVLTSQHGCVLEQHVRSTR